MSLSIIIPAYYEDLTIVSVLKSIHERVKTPHEILIIFDTLADPTYSVANEYIKKTKSVWVHLVKNNVESRKGVMNAIKTGFKQAKGDSVLVLMADLSDDIRQIDKMYQLQQKGFDVVCGSRYMKNGKKIGGPLIKTFLSKIAGLSLFYLFKVPTHDSTNAFKMYRRQIFRTISIESTNGFEFSLEITLKAYKQGYAITEIPTTWRDRDHGVSKFKLMKWLPGYIRTYLKIFT